MMPYEAPELERSRGDGATPPPGRLGPFVMTFVIMDLIWCSLRLLMAGVGAMALGSPELEKLGLADTAPWEVGTGFAMAALGIPAAVLLLCRKPLGLALGWMTLAVTVGNIGVGIWQASIRLRQIEEGTPQYSAVVIGIGVMVVLRIGLNIAYLFALVVAKGRISPSESDPRDE